jgi:hypothetical protein
MDNLSQYFSEMGKRGGSAKSPRKTKACQRNGKKGGWPKGRPRKPRKETDGNY